MARYIDADKAMSAVCIGCNKEFSDEPCAPDCCEIRREIQSIPTADVAEVKHGEWVVLEAEIGLYSCSLCEHNILRAECNYCPHCGAKMDGGKAE